MPIPENFIGVIFALASAVVWGGGDFSGGVAARRINPYQVLSLAAVTGIVLLLAITFWQGERFPAWQGVLWSMAAGLSGAFGLGLFYRGLASGYSAIVAPAAGVIGAILPVGFAFISQGMPGPVQVAGFGLAFAGIWLVSQTGESNTALTGPAFRIGCLSGAGFGGFFICLAQVEPGLVFTPLVISRSMSLLVALGMMRAYRLPAPSVRAHPIAVLTGVMDALGTVLYQLARAYTRLDIATVLASLYPAITVLLASVLLKEEVSGKQWAGVAVCLAATTLITL